jgi:hypothetical protein
MSLETSDRHLAGDGHLQNWRRRGKLGREEGTERGAMLSFMKSIESKMRSLCYT